VNIVGDLAMTVIEITAGIALHNLATDAMIESVEEGW